MMLRHFVVLLRALLCAACIFSLLACGQAGPLYLPKTPQTSTA